MWITVGKKCSTGLRQSELFGLKWEAFGLRLGRLTVTLQKPASHVCGFPRQFAVGRGVPQHSSLLYIGFNRDQFHSDLLFRSRRGETK